MKVTIGQRIEAQPVPIPDAAMTTSVFFLDEADRLKMKSIWKGTLISLIVARRSFTALAANDLDGILTSTIIHQTDNET